MEGPENGIMGPIAHVGKDRVTVVVTHSGRSLSFDQRHLERGGYGWRLARGRGAPEQRTVMEERGRAEKA
jgi:hypothetical protein